ncbi:MAG: succinate dehydrogenase, hydrophobic membrane anchor protein [Ignavibacteria bacterium]|nr:succinate dehydrogenase, hydrophobic membrane anchor protein [Ignavibacteria bacterium]HCN37707.1 succinate dehydrogenase, hydrophobic membrane anchor protein [Bacteroidota bacterium]
MYKYRASKNSGSKSWVIQRITGIALVVFMIGHYILMHYHPDSGHTYEAVLSRMQYSWYRIIDLSFLVLGMYHGLNGVWNIFRDYNLKPWQNITVLSLILILGIAFTAWGFTIIFSIPYVDTLSLSGN